MSPFVVVLYAQGKSGEEIKAACGMAGSSVRVVTMEELAALGASPSAQVWLFVFIFLKKRPQCKSGHDGRASGTRRLPLCPGLV